MALVKIRRKRKIISNIKLSKREDNLKQKFKEDVDEGETSSFYSENSSPKTLLKNKTKKERIELEEKELESNKINLLSQTNQTESIKIKLNNNLLNLKEDFFKSGK